MKIWLLTNLFPPDVHGGAVLFADLAAWLAQRGHEVRVTTTFPYYPEWRLRPGDRGCRWREETWHGLRVRRVGMYVPARPTGGRRLLAEASFAWSLLRRGRFPGWAPDAIITMTPMLAPCAALRCRPGPKDIPRLVCVQDFTADAAIELGLIRSPLLARAARALERWALGAATVLTTISPAMLDKLAAVAPPSVPRHYVPNWIHGPLARSAAARRTHAPPRADRTLVYAGNLGVKQGLPDFVRHFTAFPHDWTLVIHGAGAAAAELQALVAALGDPRVRLGGILDDEAYLDLLLGACACLITQKPGVGANFLPSKVLPCLATGTPVLAVCPPDSPLAQEVAAGGFGRVLSAAGQATLATALADLTPAAPAHRAFSAAALARAQHYSAETVLGRLAALIGA